MLNKCGEHNIKQIITPDPSERPQNLSTIIINDYGKGVPYQHKAKPFPSNKNSNHFSNYHLSIVSSTGEKNRDWRMYSDEKKKN